MNTLSRAADKTTIEMLEERLVMRSSVEVASQDSCEAGRTSRFLSGLILGKTVGPGWTMNLACSRNAALCDCLYGFITSNLNANFIMITQGTRSPRAARCSLNTACRG